MGVGAAAATATRSCSANLLKFKMNAILLPLEIDLDRCTVAKSLEIQWLIEHITLLSH